MTGWLRRKRGSGGSTNQPSTRVGRQAKRWTNWSFNLLATGLILVAGLTFGRQTMRWWAADTADVDVVEHRVPASDLGQPSVAQQLSFGDLPFSFVQRRLNGDKQAAFAELRKHCRAVAESGAGPTGTAGPAEKKMLERLPHMKPIAADSGNWQLYQLDGPLLMVSAVSPPVKTAVQVAAGESRVVSWGLAVPSGDARWTLFVYSAGSQPANTSRVAVWPPIPPNSWRSLSLKTQDGSALIGFVGHGQLGQWRRFYDDWFAERAWSADSPWRRHDVTWLRRFASSDSLVEVQVSASKEGSTGLITIATRRDHAHDSEGSND